MGGFRNLYLDSNCTVGTPNPAPVPAPAIPTPSPFPTPVFSPIPPLPAPVPAPVSAAAAAEASDLTAGNYIKGTDINIAETSSTATIQLVFNSTPTQQIWLSQNGYLGTGKKIYLPIAGYEYRIVHTAGGGSGSGLWDINANLSGDYVAAPTNTYLTSYYNTDYTVYKRGYIEVTLDSNGNGQSILTMPKTTTYNGNTVTHEAVALRFDVYLGGGSTNFPADTVGTNLATTPPFEVGYIAGTDSNSPANTYIELEFHWDGSGFGTPTPAPTPITPSPIPVPAV